MSICSAGGCRLLDAGRVLLGVPELLLDVALESFDDLLSANAVRIGRVGDVVDDGLDFHPVRLRQQPDDLVALLAILFGENVG
jgi:hypothetical protein